MNIQSTNEPELEQVITVYQKEYGYLTLESPQDYIDTIGITSCIGIHALNPLTSYQALAHIDIEFYRLTKQFMNITKQYLAGSNTKITILQCVNAKPERLNQVLQAISEEIKPDNATIITAKYAIDPIFDKKGELRMLNPDSIRQRKIKMKEYFQDILNRTELRCANTKEAIKNTE